MFGPWNDDKFLLLLALQRRLKLLRRKLQTSATRIVGLAMISCLDSRNLFLFQVTRTVSRQEAAPNKMIAMSSRTLLTTTAKVEMVSDNICPP